MFGERLTVRATAVLGVAVGLLHAACGGASPTSDYDAAEKQLASVTTWRQAQSLNRKYPRVDDGAIAAGYSEFVVHTLATKWNTVPELKRLPGPGPRFPKVRPEAHQRND
jgi:hypothetical protein